jgi:hypothetical protein
MPWVTINGNHVLIGKAKSEAAAAKARREAQAHKAAARTAAIVKSARQPATPTTPGSKTSPEMLHERARVAGYKDVSNFVAGPAHTKHAIHERIGRYDRAVDSGSRVSSPWWKGRQANTDLPQAFASPGQDLR